MFIAYPITFMNGSPLESCVKLPLLLKNMGSPSVKLKEGSDILPTVCTTTLPPQ